MVTTHLGDLKTYAFNNERAENGAVEFDVETMRPTYRLHIGQFGMSNALKIARRLKLPKELLEARPQVSQAAQGEDRRTGPAPATARGGREGEGRSTGRAARGRPRKGGRSSAARTALDREAAEKAALNELRASLKPETVVTVSRFDSTGKVVKVDAKKQTVTVSVGLGQWEIPFEEIFPLDETWRLATPASPASPSPGSSRSRRASVLPRSPRARERAAPVSPACSSLPSRRRSSTRKFSADRGRGGPGPEYEPARERWQAELAEAAGNTIPRRGQGGRRCRRSGRASCHPPCASRRYWRSRPDCDRERGAAAQHNTDEAVQDEVDARRQDRRA